MKTWLAFLFCVAWAGGIRADDKIISIDGGRISLALPPGWKKSAQNLSGTDSIAGYESSDQKTSFYVLELKLQNQADDVFGALDRTIDNFDRDENWVVKHIGKTKDADVNGLPAAYAKVELDLVAGKRKVPFVFYFTMVGARESFFMLQASTIKPIRGVREQELFRMIKSFKVIKE